ncbi:MAG TPA: LacI family DNA-binding transcriptional regulator [Rhizobiaceae bacterium]|nr:LacI family DNA-binding transcriptional regulator [Rhizobiaceae bacterium]
MNDARKPARTAAAGTVSIAAVAERAGVSIATVSRVVNGVSKRASADTAARVRVAIEELGYRPSGAGQALRRRESRLVAVIAANLANPAMSAIAASAETALREAGYVMVLCDSHDKTDLQDEYLREMRAQFVSAFVMLGAVASPVLDQIVEAGETVLFVNRRHPDDRPQCFIGIDNAGAGQEVAAHIGAGNPRDILVIHGPLTSSATRDRVDAFLTACRNELPETPVTVAGSNAADHLSIGRNEAEAYLRRHGRPPSAIFALSDLIAYGAARALRDAGHAVPETCRITGFDDNPLNDWIAPWLSSVRVPYEHFGAAIVASLKVMSVEQAGPRDVLLKHMLVRR